MHRYALKPGAVLLLALLACAHSSARSADTPTAAYDHTDPVRLNERALVFARNGSLGKALILLERAALLAPQDERILRNLYVLRAARAGQTLAPISARAVPDPDLAPAATTITTTTPTPTPRAAPILPEPPAAWPRQTTELVPGVVSVR